LSAVGTEAFSEWVIEDDFKGARPNWDKAGVQFTSDIRKFETRKLRLLNAAHSYLAYAGLLRGHTYVHEAISDPVLLKGVCGLWDEAQTTLDGSDDEETSAYRAALIERFAVPQVRHNLIQIASDGSVKLTERIVPILSNRRKNGLSIQYTEGVLKIWADYVQNRLQIGLTLDDPNAANFQKLFDSGQDRKVFISALFDNVHRQTQTEIS